MKKFLSLALVVLVFAGLSAVVSCSGEETPKDTFLSGTVSGATGQDDVVVTLYNNKTRKENSNTIMETVGSEHNWKYNINVPYGKYMSCAFIDANKDGEYSMGERWGCNTEMSNISKGSKNANRDITINNQ